MPHEHVNIAIIGASWNGINLSSYLDCARKELAQEMGIDSENIVIESFECAPDILEGTSSIFLLRLHKGLHYLNSPETRKNCRKTFDLFVAEFGDLLNDCEFSIYAHSKTDYNQEPSKVTRQQFQKASEEDETAQKINASDHGLRNVDHLAYNTKEKFISTGEKLRAKLHEYLKRRNIKINLNHLVTDIEQTDSGHKVSYFDNLGQAKTKVFTHVINATGFQAFATPRNQMPFGIDYVYQPCMGIKYIDRAPTTEKPIAWIITDGFFPCLMPVFEQGNESENNRTHQYLVTHGSLTILDSCKTLKDAKRVLQDLTKDKQNYLKSECEKEVHKYFPAFQTNRFEFKGFEFGIVAKPKTKSEFRSAFVFKDPKEIIQFFPGKGADIFLLFDEIFNLILGKNCLKTANNCMYIKNGTLDQGHAELKTKPQKNEKHRHTCYIHTVQELEHQETSATHNSKKPYTHQPPLTFFSRSKSLSNINKPRNYFLRPDNNNNTRSSELDIYLQFGNKPYPLRNSSITLTSIHPDAFFKHIYAGRLDNKRPSPDSKSKLKRHKSHETRESILARP